MPRYTNTTNRYVGKEFLKIPPKTKDFKSIFYYIDDDIDIFVDDPPFYNPVKFQKIIDYDGDTTTYIDLPYEILGDFHLVIYTKCNKTNVFDAINVIFNNINNLPALPLTNSEFELQMHNRIKRLQITTKKKTKGQIVVMVVDKYVPSYAVLDQAGQNSSP